jgi:hypothetical protein
MAMYPYVALRGPTYRENSHAKHLASAFAANRLFLKPATSFRVGSIPIARSTFCCLACPSVVLGRGSAHRPIPTVSTRLQFI